MFCYILLLKVWIINNMRSTFISDVQNLLKKVIRCKIFRLNIPPMDGTYCLHILGDILWCLCPWALPSPPPGRESPGRPPPARCVCRASWSAQAGNKTKRSGSNQFCQSENVMSYIYYYILCNRFQFTWSSNTGESWDTKLT